MKKAQAILNDSPDLNPPDVLAWQYEASPDAVAYVLAQPVSEDGRSTWTWLRLANGDLALAIFPRGDTYEYVSQTDAACEYPANS